MPVGNELRIARLRRLHAKFLDASDVHPQLYHACVRSGNPHLSRILRWHDKGLGLSPSHEELWTAAIMGSEQCGNLGAFLSSYPGSLNLQSGEWMGRYIGWANEDARGDFCRLSEDMLPEIEDVSEHRRFADAPWLETLYNVIACPRETVAIRNCCETLPEGEVEVIGLPWNVFLASAKAIEILIDRELPLVKTPSGLLLLDAFSASVDQVVGNRPAYQRDHLWLKWREEESLTPAKIRDRWDSMTDERRKGACPGACERVGNASKKAGREVVVKGLKKARAEKAIQHSTHGQPNER
jgi:hypothetical protein